MTTTREQILALAEAHYLAYKTPSGHYAATSLHSTTHVEAFYHAARKPLEEEIEGLQGRFVKDQERIECQVEQLAEAQSNVERLREVIQYYVDREPSRPVGANISVGIDAIARSKS